MANFTVTTNAAQDRAIAYFVAKGRAPSTGALVQQVAAQALSDLAERAREQESGDLREAFRAATPDVQQQVRTLLGSNL